MTQFPFQPLARSNANVIDLSHPRANGTPMGSISPGIALSEPSALPPTFDLDDFFENSAVALHFVAAKGTILRANRAELDLLGYSPEEYIGHHIAKFH